MPHDNCDDSLTSQERDNREWRAADVILMLVGVIVAGGVIVILAGFGWRH
jgi:hypothetical protein